ncbi:hypothetical protein [Dyadobacter pollutisoli]|jgi:hypothetical protein|uniref:Uncharacterized protein n=1 Tax=Dyadobacter pollutisoli TaxID=2910158 RepID=A0A9E8NDT8_9BACT|nr:hypothetical protein [Dyadobacter pollutisoli]WAC12354.1 hypothetical protein ON006_00025 [Dyadobacter pollutisoli]
MGKPIRKFREKLSSSSSNDFNLEEFKKALKDLTKNPSAENLGRINHIRRWFVLSTGVMEGISRQVEGLTRKLRNPNEEDMQIIYALISSCRYLATNSELLVTDYEILLEGGILVTEIDDFKEACLCVKKATFYIESVYLSLPNRQEVNDLVRRN